MTLNQGKCNVFHSSNEFPLICDYTLHGLAIMGCSNIQLYSNISSSLSWIRSNIMGSIINHEYYDSMIQEKVLNEQRIEPTLPIQVLQVYSKASAITNSSSYVKFLFTVASSL